MLVATIGATLVVAMQTGFDNNGLLNIETFVSSSGVVLQTDVISGAAGGTAFGQMTSNLGDNFCLDLLLRLIYCLTLVSPWNLTPSPLIP